MSLTSKRIYQFGEFTLRVGGRVLERDGKPVPLGSKAFEVLVCLVGRAGEVVTKDELLKAVWPESFVEEGNLAQHVFALRKALGDRSGYIVTIPGRGYQFTEPVQEEGERPVRGDAGTFLLERRRERTHIVIEETSGPAGGSAIRRAGEPGMESVTEEEVAAGRTRAGVELPKDRPGLLGARRARVPAWAVTAVVLAGGAGAWLAWRWFSRPERPNQRLVLAELDNRTGDEGFDVVLRNALEIDLDQSPYIDVMSQAEELNTLRLMGRDVQTALVGEVAREVCVRSNRQVLIEGAVASVGKTYLLTLKATDCESGKHLAAVKAEAASKEETLAALDEASARLRRGLGESRESLERFQVPIAQATTSSLEALKQYSVGEYLLGRMGKEESEVLPFFERALELDPNFAMAAAAVATGDYSLGEWKLAEPYYQRAFDLSGRVSEKERLYIRAHYYSDDRRDVKKGIEAYEMWAAEYPRDWGPWLNMAIEYAQLGDYDAAISSGERALQLDPSRGIIYGVLARNYMHAGRYREAEETGRRAREVGRNSVLLRMTLFETALLQGDRPGMDGEIEQSKGKPGEWDFLDMLALAAAREGRHARAEGLFHAAYAAALADRLSEKADGILVDEATAEFDWGMPAAARATLKRVGPEYADAPYATLLRAKLGDAAAAERALAANGGADSSDTLMSSVYGPLIRAQIALDAGRSADAATQLEAAGAYDYAAGYAMIAARGEAYSKMKEPAKAVAEYQKILQHPGIDPVSVLYPLALVGKARAEAQAGNRQQSRADYEQFFAQWKNADAGMPVLEDARREYASLSAR